MDKKIIEIDNVNRNAKEDLKQFVEQCENGYHSKISEVAEAVAQNIENIKIVLLSGPSSSGKTTTSEILIKKLAEKNIDSITVSTDDFFVDRERTPKNPDGSFDYENVAATDLSLLKACLKELVRNGTAYFPKYNFITGESIRRGRFVRLPKNGIIIVEGIHALNPILTDDELMQKSMKLYVCVFTNFALNNKIMLTARELRLTRRILRDCLTRGIAPEKSVEVWKDVLRGEDKYIKPFIGCADYVIDTTHFYEPLVYKNLIVPKLSEIKNNVTENLLKDYALFIEATRDVIPENSLLNEFVVK